MADSVKDSKCLTEANSESRLEFDEISRRMENGLKRAFSIPANPMKNRKQGRGQKRAKPSG